MTQDTEAPAQGLATVDTTPKATGDPLQGAAGDPNRVPSALSGTPQTDPTGSLAKMAQMDPPADPTVAPADQTGVKEFAGPDGTKITAAATDPKTTALGAGGQQLPPGGEVAGGNIAKTLDPPRDPSLTNVPFTKERAAMLSTVGRKIMGLINRPPAEWGVLGPGDKIIGHMILVDLNTGEKVRAMDGHVINDGGLFMNARNLPESLANGDTLEVLLSGS